MFVTKCRPGSSSIKEAEFPKNLTDIQKVNGTSVAQFILPEFIVKGDPRCILINITAVDEEENSITELKVSL